VKRVARIWLGCSLFWSLRLSAQCPDGSPPPCRPTSHITPPPAPNSVAVLYFDNLSPDTSDAYLADGITEEIASRLPDIRRMLAKQASREGVRRLRETAPDYRIAAGRALGVRYLVEGSLRRAGSRVRVVVRLINGTNGFRTWGETYDRAAQDLLVLEDDIARQVARAVAGRLSPAEAAAIAPGPSRNPEAHEHYLRGNFYLFQRTAPALRRAIDEYEAAARIDPGFGDALGRIGYAYSLCLDLNLCRDLPHDSLLARGLAVTDRALRRDSASADAWLARGALLQDADPRRYTGVEQALERALALAPRNAEAWHRYGLFLRSVGRDSAATTAYHQALDIEPLRTIELNGLGATAFWAHQFEAAARWLDSALAVDPGLPNAYYLRARLRMLLGDTAGARADAEAYLRLTGNRLIEVINARIAAARGDAAEARRALDQLRRDAQSDWEAHVVILVALHEYADALAILEGVQPGLELWAILRDPELESLRSNPRFQRLVEESWPR